MARHRSRLAGEIPPALVRLIHAANRAGEDPGRRELRTAAEGLREYGALAVWVLPVHGLFVPNAEPVSGLIEQAAKRHFGLAEARRELREALKVVGPFEQREPIESAMTQVHAASDAAYFYAGVAFGAALTPSQYGYPSCCSAGSPHCPVTDNVRVHAAFDVDLR